MQQQPTDFTWVVVHGVRTFVDGEGKSGPMFLGQFGWVPRVNQAQQFVAKDEAMTAIRIGQRDTPMLYRNSNPSAQRVERPSGEVGSMQHEYEPFAGLNG